MPITIGSNIESLRSQRRLAQSTADLSKVFQRLSSGLRINSAADDAAGLAIASSLKVDVRVFTQAVRNINDGIGMLAVEDGALSSLSGILFRQRELATQAANGVYSHVQRQALDKEAEQLTAEFNRIVATTKFNGLALLDGSVSSTTIQAGYGEAGGITVRDVGLASRYVGEGTFQDAGQLNASGTDPWGIGAADFTGDGRADIVTNARADNQVRLLEGNGDGTFKAGYSIGASIDGSDLLVGDLNGDGLADIVAANYVTSEVTVFISNGDGSFEVPREYAVASGNAWGMALSDLNSDGAMDVVVPGNNSGTYNILMGNSDGSFNASVVYNTGADNQTAKAGDFNGDGRMDLVIGPGNSQTYMQIAIGNGDGSFKSAVTYFHDSGTRENRGITVGDYNGDNRLDVATSDNDGAVNIFIGNGDGTFRIGVEYFTTASAAGAIDTGDLNGDDVLDLVVAGYGGSENNVFFGNGDGTFKAPVSLATSVGPRGLVLVDVTGEGVKDILSASYVGDRIGVYVTDSHQAATLGALDLTTAQGARDAMDSIDDALRSVSTVRGKLGAFQSRLEAALHVLQATGENSLRAASMIEDADVSQETNALARLSILQNAGSAILAQANQQPALALTLLRG